MNHRYISFDYSALLSKVVHDIYELTNYGEETTYSTAPNGIIGISIVLEGGSTFKRSGSWIPIPASSVYGLIMQPDAIKMTGGFREIAIGFKPMFFHMLIANDMREITTNPMLASDELFSKDSLDQLRERLGSSIDDLEIVHAIEDFVSSHLRESHFDQRLNTAMDLIYSDRVYNVAELSKRLAISSTTLRQLFQKGIGRSPKELTRIMRIHRVLWSMKPFEEIDVQDLIYQSNYFDQAHFIRDFKSLMGITPKKYLNHSHAFDFYNYGRWQGEIFEG